MMTLANHPRLAMATLNYGKYLLVESSLSLRQRELLILRVAWRYHSHYQWAHHVVSARQIGFGDAEIEALKLGPAAPLWNGEDRALLSAIDQMCDMGTIDDPTWAELQRFLDQQQMMDMLFSVGFFTMNAWAFSAMGLQLEPGFEAFSTSMALEG